MSKHTVFNVDWLSDQNFSAWLGQHQTSNKKAVCKICKKDIELGNMGKQALKSHATGNKHKLKCKLSTNIHGDQQTLSNLWGRASSQTLGSANPDADTTEKTLTSTAECVSSPIPSHHVTSDQAPMKDSSNNQPPVSNYAAPDSVLTAEILWTIKTVSSHYSSSSSANVSSLFQRMFPDSAIAQKFQCGKTKCSYLIKHGLAPYFHKELIDIISEPNCLFSVSFDESFNKILQQEQMDLVVRFWDKELKQVVSRYLTSEFLGHTRATDLLDKFVTALAQLNLGNLVQIGMDGPSTNWKFFKEFQDKHKADHPELPHLLNLGSCNLHVVHGAIKSGAEATGWGIASLLRGVFYLLRDSPARQEDYQQLCPEAKLPLKFCATRWLEDVPVAQRAIEIWPHIMQYVKKVSQGPKADVPKSKSYLTVLENSGDPLIQDKLQFFVSVASLLRPYLEKYQTEKPMMMFMGEDLEKLLRSLLQKFIKPDVLNDANTAFKLTQLDLNDKDILASPKLVELGFGIRSSLKKLEKEKKTSQLQIRKFEVECQNFLLVVSKKILDKSPLSSQFVRSLKSLDPRYIATAPDNAKDLFRNVLNKLLACKRLSADMCDEAMTQFNNFIFEVSKYHQEAFINYKPDQRIDQFYEALLDGHEAYHTLWDVIKLAMILSHGQSEVERGFSTNKEILANNMQGETVIAYRRVHDAISKRQEKTEEVVVTKEMLASCRMARSRYILHLEEQKKAEKSAENDTRKQELSSCLNTLEKTKAKLQSEHDMLIDKADRLCREAEKSHSWNKVVEANALRDKSKLKRKDIEKTEESIKEITKKLKVDYK